MSDGVRQLSREAAKFGLVGVFNLALDVGIFNLLTFTVLTHRPFVAKVISTTIAVLSSYFMNRHWTWRDRARRGVHRELPLFLLLSGVGLGIALACLAVSRYGLGLHSHLADNVAANVVGLVLGTAWRFLTMRQWVFVTGDRAGTTAT